MLDSAMPVPVVLGFVVLGFVVLGSEKGVKIEVIDFLRMSTTMKWLLVKGQGALVLLAFPESASASPI